MGGGGGGGGVGGGGGDATTMHTDHAHFTSRATKDVV